MHYTPSSIQGHVQTIQTQIYLNYWISYIHFFHLLQSCLSARILLLPKMFSPVCGDLEKSHSICSFVWWPTPISLLSLYSGILTCLHINKWRNEVWLFSKRKEQKCLWWKEHEFGSQSDLSSSHACPFLFLKTCLNFLLFPRFSLFIYTVGLIKLPSSFWEWL